MGRWLVVMLVLALAGCHHRDAAGTLEIVASVPLEAALRAAAPGTRIEVARSPGVGHKLDADHADVVIADSATVDRLIAAGKLDVATRRALVVDRLEIIAQPGSPVPVQKPQDVGQIDAPMPPWRGRLALLDPDSWPEGALARTTLQAMGVWDRVQGRVQPVASLDDLSRAVSGHKRMLGVLGHSEVVGLGDRVHVLAPLGPSVVYQAVVAAQARHHDAAAKLVRELALAPFEQRGFAGAK